MTAEEFVGGYEVMFDAPLRLALEAVLSYAGKMEPDGWPSVPTIWRFARFYDVDVGQLSALCGVLSYKLRGKTFFCDSRRDPAHIRMTPTVKFSRKVLAAYGFYVTIAELSERS